VDFLPLHLWRVAAGFDLLQGCFFNHGFPPSA
jgi:hypothetical protein